MAQEYEKAGVSLEAGYESVRRIKSHVDRTQIPGAMDSLGAFGGCFDLSGLGLKEPVLVSGTDGVGTKLMLAFAMDKHDTIGIDAVAMCVNDVIVQGAAPLFFLDYIAVGKNKPAVIEQIVKGVADGCVQAECALIGGETAEMPGMYDPDHYDLAGFCVGAVEKAKLRTKGNVKTGDVLVGIPSSGIHSNGFSLARFALFLKGKKLPTDRLPELDNERIGDVLLTPTRIYVKDVKKLLESVDVHGMAHITGGGFYENVPRMLSEGQGARIDKSSFERPAIFDVIQQAGGIKEEEMYNVFNMGIGFVLAVDAADAEQTLSVIPDARVIGTVTDSGRIEVS